MAALYGQISAFEVDSERAIVGWEEWCERLDQYFIANDIAQDGDNRRCKAIFLSSVGAKTYSLVRTLCHPAKPETKTLADLQKLVKDHLSPEPIVIAERFAFYNRKQGAAESAAEFLNALRRLAETCKFENFRDEALRDMFVIGIRDRDVQKKLLAEKDLTLQRAFSLAQASERTKQHIDEMCGEVSKVGFHRSLGASSKPENVERKQKPCFVCGRLGHWKAQCPENSSSKYRYKKSKGVKKVDANQSQSDSEGEYLKVVRTNRQSIAKVSRIPEIMVDVVINGRGLQMEVDTGASVSLISQSEFRKLDLDAYLTKSDMKLSTITGEDIKVHGECKLPVAYQGHTYADLCLYVVDACGPALLGRDWLSVIKLDWGLIKATTNVKVEDLTQRYSSLFDGDLGCVSGLKAELVLQEKAVTKFCKPRPVPFALKAEIEQEINRLVQQGVLRKLEYSDWAAPIVPVRKSSGGLRICGDYSVALNRHLKVPEHPMPNIEELLTKLNGGRMFSKLDLSQAYQQIQLDEKSQELVAINTHIGLYTYNRVPYGISAAPALFQGVMDKVLQGLACGCYLDDIVVTGRTEDEHLKNLEAVLSRLTEYGFRLQKSKCEFMRSSIHYLGFMVDSDGVRMDGSATEALKHAPVPVNKGELQSFLGLANQYRKFVANMSMVAAPLNELLRKDVHWKWTTACEQSFTKIKELLTQENVLTHYDPDGELCLSVDASPTGLGAVLTQKVDREEKPIAFGSRTLTAAEKNYSQLDREALAIIYGVKKFHYYLYGRKFVLFSDNLPLCHILSPKRGMPGLAAARIQRWALELADYNFEVKHRPGSRNVTADGLSRLPLPTTELHPDIVRWASEATEVNERAISSLPVNATQVAQSTRTDIVLSRVLQYVRTGWPTEVDGELKAYFSRKLELTVEQDCLLWGCRVVVPVKLREKLMTELHEGHNGMVRMKALARLHFWWPNLDREIEQMVRSCEMCRSALSTAPKLSHNSWAWPDRAWSRVHIDFAQIKDDHYLIMVDAHSKWPEVLYMKNGTTAEKTIEALRAVFGRMGLCEEIVSDNGPPFASREFKEFLRNNGIRQILSAPYHPSSNGEAERFVRTFKKGVKCGGRKSRNHACQQFLLSYRSTPHSTTGKTPSEMIFGRRIRTRLDLVKPDLQRKISREARGCKTPRSFDVGDLVLIKDYRSSQKGTWVEGVVVEVKSPVTYTVEVEINGQVVSWKRHVDQLRANAGSVESDINMPLDDSFPKYGEPLLLPHMFSTVDQQEGEDRQTNSTEPVTDAREIGGRAPRPPSPETEEMRVGLRRTDRTRRAPAYLAEYDCA